MMMLMRRRGRYYFLALALLTAIPATSHANWFAREDSGGKIVLTGTAVDPQGTNAVYLTCENGDQLQFTTLTWNGGPAAQLSDYINTKVTFKYPDSEWRSQEFSIMGTPVFVPWNVVAIQTKLSPEQSKLIVEPIFRGEKISITLSQPNLQMETEPKVINGGVFNATIALAKSCPSLR